MNGILADVNLRGQMELVVRILNGAEWNDLWNAMGTPFVRFDDLGLSDTATDREIWLLCQDREFVLVTGNRNRDGSDSLQATIESLGTVESPPVFTVGDPDEMMRSKGYAEQVAERLFEYILDIDNHRGAGRLYLP